ncbi:CHRD domain-containing protein [Phenylobacterium sp.]|uniref:CHRD domain-containing protein n=1 Tax=Phenylobacterium sp. TaxID=1871053 RepID=UPI002899BA11|nr:CHRD domain-containing protein [Phenylobacterium sp.]
MPDTTLKLAAIAVCLTLAGAAKAATVYRAPLLGANENPPIASPGHGVALLAIDGDLLTVAASFDDLLGGVAAAHIHCCAPAPANAGVATQTPTFVGFPSGVASGSYQQDFSLTALSTYNPAFVTANGGTAESARNVLLAALDNGQAYFNIHTTFAPAGEIRGQFALVPEPASWALMIAGFGLAGAAIRWRRRVFTA